jgi:hypothetical protein
MLLPSKVTPYGESVLSKFPIFLRELESGSVTVLDLFEYVKSEVVNVGEFIEILDCLYALRKVGLSSETQNLYLLDKEADS